MRYNCNVPVSYDYTGHLYLYAVYLYNILYMDLGSVAVPIPYVIPYVIPYRIIIPVRYRRIDPIQIIP